MQPLISLRGLTRSFPQRQGLFGPKRELFAVRDVNLDLFAGETLGLVGESGCGKSTLGRMAVGLLPPTLGDVLFEGKSLLHPAAGEKLKELRKGLCRKIQMVFQDPFSSLNPRMRVGESVGEPLLCAAGAEPSNSEAGRREAVAAMLEQVGLSKEHAGRYPHEFSGGQRQRIAIARALVTHPAFVVCDEPTSSLDSSVQAQVLNLLAELQEKLGLTYLFISHDLSVVRHMSDRVAVMYAGFIVEEAGAQEIFSRPYHPYTRLLLDSAPDIAAEASSADCASTLPKEAEGGEQGTAQSSGSGTGAGNDTGTANAGQKTDKSKGGAISAGQVRGALPDTGCPFEPRCPRRLALCREILPELKIYKGTPGETRSRRARCHNPLACH